MTLDRTDGGTPSSEGRAALPEMNGPDVLLHTHCSAQNLPTVLPEAFEHHLHGVLYMGEKVTLK